MTRISDWELDEDEQARPRIGNTAPDWGHNYGINELWSEVAPGLFVGGTHDNDTVDIGRDALRKMYNFYVREDAEIGPREFDAVVTMYAWARPVDWGVEELRWGIPDAEGDGLDLEGVRETVIWAHRRWKAGKKVLVRCQAGLNRSSLIASLVLVREGVEPAEAINKIRRTRSRKALFNRSFEAAVLDTPTDFWRQ
jgi:protein-tyrosine phosphatase